VWEESTGMSGAAKDGWERWGKGGGCRNRRGATRRGEKEGYGRLHELGDGTGEQRREGWGGDGRECGDVGREVEWGRVEWGEGVEGERG